jgi:hypothetical protein
LQSASGSRVSRLIVCTLKVHTIERAADGGEERMLVDMRDTDHFVPPSVAGR